MKNLIVLIRVLVVFLTVSVLVPAANAAPKQNPEWHSFLFHKQNLTRSEFANALERNDRSLLRATPKKFAQLFANLGLPVTEDPRELAAFIRSNNDITVVPCTTELIQRLELARINDNGDVDFHYGRRACIEGEHFLVWKERQPFVSLGCGNAAREAPQEVIIARPGPRLSLPPVQTSGRCPDIYTLKCNVWPSSALTFPGVQQAISAAEAGTGQRFMDASRLSRKLDADFRAEAARNPNFQRSHTSRLFRISLVQIDNEKGRVRAEQILGYFNVVGLREFKFTPQQLREWDAIQILDVREEMRSPVFNGLNSLKMILFFNTAKYNGLPMGEWSTNPVPDCLMNVHAIENEEGNLPVTFGDTQSSSTLTIR